MNLHDEPGTLHASPADYDARKVTRKEDRDYQARIMYLATKRRSTHGNASTQSDYSPWKGPYVPPVTRLEAYVNRLRPHDNVATCSNSYSRCQLIRFKRGIAIRVVVARRKWFCLSLELSFQFTIDDFVDLRTVPHIKSAVSPSSPQLIKS